MSDAASIVSLKKALNGAVTAGKVEVRSCLSLSKGKYG